MDLVRYICVVVHPTNEQLNSGLTPRWALCGWLLNTCTSPVDAANLKLALFFDWLLYDAKRDNIMLIEPAVLLMYNSMKIAQSGPAFGLNVTSMLFDFLCRVSVNYCWPCKEQVLAGIMHSFRDSVEKRVIPTLQVFFAQMDTAATTPGIAAKTGGKEQTPAQTQPVLDKELRALLQTTFGDFFQTLNVNQTSLLTSSASSSSSLSKISSGSTLSMPTVAVTGVAQSQTQIRPLMSQDITSPSSATFMPISQSK